MLTYTFVVKNFYQNAEKYFIAGAAVITVNIHGEIFAPYRSVPIVPGIADRFADGVLHKPAIFTAALFGDFRIQFLCQELIGIGGIQGNGCA